MISRDKPSTVTQQRKAMGPRLVGKCPCTEAPHGCHPQSQSHRFQEKENHTCTFKRERLWVLKVSLNQKHNSFTNPSKLLYVTSKYFFKLKLKTTLQNTIFNYN